MSLFTAFVLKSILSDMSIATPQTILSTVVFCFREEAGNKFNLRQIELEVPLRHPECSFWQMEVQAWKWEEKSGLYTVS